MTHILVTGATGFIGGHLLPVLVQSGYRVRATTRSHTIANSTPIEWVPVADLTATTDWDAALSGVDCVIHLAARAHILQDEVADPEAAFQQANTAATAHLVQRAIAHGVQQFIFLSSIGAMATLSDRTLDERSPCHPDTPYGRSKRAAEQAIQALCAPRSMTWTILRPTLVYGPHNPGNMALLLKLVHQSWPLPLGAVRNRRSLVYVGNLVDVIHRCIAHPAAQNQTFVVSDGTPLSTPALLRQMSTAMGQPARLWPVPPRLLQLGARLLGQSARLERLTGSLAVDSTHLTNALDWTPPYRFEQGLQETVDWFLDQAVSQYP